MKNKKKILAAAGILVLAGVAAVCYIQNRDKKEAASIRIIGGADGPTKIFLAGKIGSPDEETKAAVLDLETAKKQSYGDVVELDYVSKDKISLHGSFGYISFNINSSDDPATLEPAAAYTLEEAGPIVTRAMITRRLSEMRMAAWWHRKHTRRKRTRCTFTLTLMGM